MIFSRWIAALLVGSFIFSGCSLERKNIDGIKVVLDRSAERLASEMSLLASPTSPTTIGDFSCYLLNVTGNGIPEGALSGCTPSGNFQGRGVGFTSLPTKGNVIPVQVPLGDVRTFDVYGLFPPTGTCMSESSDVGATSGYFLGNAVSDLVASLTVNIPVAFNGGASAFSCNGASASATKYFFYIASQGSGTISAFSFDAQAGALTAVAGGSGVLGAANRVRVAPNGKFLYATVSGGSTINLFTINQTTGALPAAPTGSVSPDGNPILDLVFAPDSSMMWVLTTPNVTPITLDTTTGAMVVGASFAHGVAATIVGLGVTGKSGFAYVESTSVGGLFQRFSVSAVGDLSGGTADLSGVPGSGLRLDPTRRFGYAINGASIQQLAINATTGVISTIAAAFAMGGVVTGFDFHPAGTFLFADFAGSQAQALATNTSTGAISAPNLAVGTTGTPLQLAVDTTGKFLLVGTSTSNTIQITPINASTGQLNTASTFALAATPDEVAFATVP